MQVNSTDWQQLSFEAGGFVGGGVLEVHAVGSSQDYYQTFSAVAAVAGVPRAGERLTFEQTIDTSHRAVNAQWTRLISRVTMIVGADYRHTESHQDELRYALVGGVNTLEPGARSRRAAPSRSRPATRAPASTPRDALTIELGARADSWNSEPEDPALPTKDVSLTSARAPR